MANIIHYLTHIRLEFRRSSNQMKLIVIGIIVFGCVGLFALRSTIRSTQEDNDFLMTQAAQLEQENGQLQDKTDKKGTLEGLLEFAEDFLGLVDPNSVIFGSGN